MAEYEAFGNGLHIAIELGVRCLDVRGDSQLVIDHVIKKVQAATTQEWKPIAKRFDAWRTCSLA
jgi:ribonuclease HI